MFDNVGTIVFRLPLNPQFFAKGNPSRERGQGSTPHMRLRVIASRSSLVNSFFFGDVSNYEI